MRGTEKKKGPGSVIDPGPSTVSNSEELNRAADSSPMRIMSQTLARADNIRLPIVLVAVLAAGASPVLMWGGPSCDCL